MVKWCKAIIVLCQNSSNRHWEDKVYFVSWKILFVSINFFIEIILIPGCKKEEEEESDQRRRERGIWTEGILLMLLRELQIQLYKEQMKEYSSYYLNTCIGLIEKKIFYSN